MHIAILAIIFILGLCVGSFLNCFIWRLHTGKSLGGRSMCPKCAQTIAWYDNMPVLSFVLLKGKCRHCSQIISWQYPVVEFITAILFSVALVNNMKWAAGSNVEFYSLITDSKLLITICRDWFIIAVMIVIFVYDLRWYLIPDIVVLPACAIIFALNLFLGFNWLFLLLFGILGASFFLIQFIISKGKWIGGGDIRLGLLMGLALGRLDYLILAIILAYFIGSIVGIGLIATKKKKWGSQVPLGVFLTTSVVITLFFGDFIINWYLGLL